MKRGRGNRRIGIFVLFAVLAAVFCAGCLNPTEPAKPAAGPKVLVVYIAGEAPVERTALPPAPVPAQYTITVERPSAPGTPLGTATFTTLLASYLIELSDAPAVDDVVKVVSHDSNSVKNAEGTYSLKSENINGTTPVIVTVRPVMDGTGNVDLSVSFDRFNANSEEITLAKLELYQDLANYTANTPLSGKGAQYQKDGSYGTGTIFTGTNSFSIPINYPNLASGNYVLMIEFFRGSASDLVKVSRLVQTIIVRGGLVTNRWVETGNSVLTWNAFASSNANLAASDGIKINGSTIGSYAPATIIYNIYEPTTTIPTKTLTVNRGEPGQAIEVVLNGGSTVSLVSGISKTFTELGSPNYRNTLAITVTAPDGITKKTYTVDISGRELIEFYFTIDGKIYGVRPAGSPEAPQPDSGSSGGTTGNPTITVTVPYGTDMSALSPTITQSGKSASWDSNDPWVSPIKTKTYTITAVDDSTTPYSVTVQEHAGLTIQVTVQGLGVFTFASLPTTVQLGGSPITITPNPTLTDDVTWHINISGPVSPPTSTSTGKTGSFAVPTKRGFYNVNVFAIIGDIPYSGSFGLVVD
jgi:hypothetical protein